MSTLVSVPWQPGYKLTPDTLGYLEAASDRLGTQLWLTDAWRSYAEQKYYWDAYQAGWGNPASNPDSGQRNHMRGAALDLVRVDAAARAACRAVGLIPDGAEAWHWNNPNWANMPIIPTDTSPAATNITPLALTPTLEIDDMKLILDTSNDTVAAVGAGRYYPVGTPTKTTNASYKAIAKVWGDLTDATRLTHEEFIENVHAACGDIDLAKPYPR